MDEVTLSDWAPVILSTGAAYAFAFYFGRVSFQVWLRLSKTDRCLYVKWGVERDLFWPISRAQIIYRCAGYLFGTVIYLVIALFTVQLIVDSWQMGTYTILSFLVCVLAIGFDFESQRFKDIRHKVKDLEDLREVFHNRFSVSDLLSVYESLEYAPRLFWKEYSDLPEEEVSEATNQKYRERAAPYRYSLSIKYNRILIVVAVLAIVVPSLLAVVNYFL